MLLWFMNFNGRLLKLYDAYHLRVWKFIMIYFSFGISMIVQIWFEVIYIFLVFYPIMHIPLQISLLIQ